jgi:hypothetical protein
MTNEAMNMAVAKWMGLCTEKAYNQTGDWETAVCHSCGKNPYDAAHNLPNFPGDLNAVREAEAKLHSLKMWSSYGRYLYRAVHGQYPNSDQMVGHSENSIAFGLISATAPQRCEALLRTVGLWEDKQ